MCHSSPQTALLQPRKCSAGSAAYTGGSGGQCFTRSSHRALFKLAWQSCTDNGRQCVSWTKCEAPLATGSTTVSTAHSRQPLRSAFCTMLLLLLLPLLAAVPIVLVVVHRPSSCSQWRVACSCCAVIGGSTSAVWSLLLLLLAGMLLPLGCSCSGRQDAGCGHSDVQVDIDVEA
eukprot:15891-Heterococcus_DN1.PRE.5